MKFDTNGSTVECQYHFVLIGAIPNVTVLDWCLHVRMQEKVYSVSETPTQHTCGVSKANENLTNGLKITTHQLKLYKTKRHKYP